MAPAALSFDANRFPNKVRASNDCFAVARAIGTVTRARPFKYLYDEAAQVVADESLPEPLSNPAMVITTFSQHRFLIIRHFDYLIAHDAAGIRMPDELCHFHAMLPAVRRVFETDNEYAEFFDLCCFKEGSVPKYKPPASCPDTFPDYVPVVQPTEKRNFFLNWRGFDPKLLQEAFKFCTQVISNMDFTISPAKVESFFKSFRQALASDAPNFVHMARDNFPDSLQVLYIGLYTAAVSLPSKKKASVLKDLNWMKDNPVLALEDLPSSFVLPPGPKPKPIPVTEGAEDAHHQQALASQNVSCRDCQAPRPFILFDVLKAVWLLRNPQRITIFKSVDYSGQYKDMLDVILAHPHIFPIAYQSRPLSGESGVPG
ncbi:hypothetical protein FB45DRAFT_1052544 [Roridomyces roridus]|uniref:Uncharacterized protein n=1 Tax=Roridomyces roridus TaxID=1738132 RepID=A0AAD7CAC5_9AGAR|nr:hypothetical protein FB45DRAFT_1052544 [Roridomyces roridus]